MKVAVCGLGHVGLVTAVTLAGAGHDVTGVELDDEKLRMLKRGTVPFLEPGLPEALDAQLGTRLRFVGDIGSAVESDVVFACVGTPSKPSGDADVSQIERLARSLAQHMDGYTVVVEKSTVPSGTGRRLAEMLERYLGHDNFDVVSNPEFLREGRALEDALRPDRIVIGSSSERAIRRMRELYAPIVESSGCDVIVTDINSAELIKHASNAFLATKISFINFVGEICERLPADVDVVARGMGLDPRIGDAFLSAGAGYGGSCFPKDVAAFGALARSLGVDVGLLEQVQVINDRAVPRIVDKLREKLWVLDGKRIAVLGLAFKPNTDDVRHAPALRLIEFLEREQARVVAYDPAAMPSAKEVVSGVHFAASATDALDGSDAAVVMTEWDEFRALQPADFARLLRFPVVVDGRNVFSAEEMAAGGVTYVATGRPELPT